MVGVLSEKSPGLCVLSQEWHGWPGSRPCVAACIVPSGRHSTGMLQHSKRTVFPVFSRCAPRRKMLDGQTTGRTFSLMNTASPHAGTARDSPRRLIFQTQLVRSAAVERRALGSVKSWGSAPAPPNATPRGDGDLGAQDHRRHRAEGGRRAASALPSEEEPPSYR